MRGYEEKLQKVQKYPHTRLDFHEIFTKCFFYQYYDPDQISSRLHDYTGLGQTSFIGKFREK